MVLLADKLKQLEAHGFVSRPYSEGDDVMIEWTGEFLLSFTAKGRRIFLATEGQASNYAGDTPNPISQQVGDFGPGDPCLFGPGAEVASVE